MRIDSRSQFKIFFLRYVCGQHLVSKFSHQPTSHLPWKSLTQKSPRVTNADSKLAKWSIRGRAELSHAVSMPHRYRRLGETITSRISTMVCASKRANTAFIVSLPRSTPPLSLTPLFTLHTSIRYHNHTPGAQEPDIVQTHFLERLWSMQQIACTQHQRPCSATLMVSCVNSSLAALTTACLLHSLASKTWKAWFQCCPVNAIHGTLGCQHD